MCSLLVLSFQVRILLFLAFSFAVGRLKRDLSDHDETDIATKVKKEGIMELMRVILKMIKALKHVMASGCRCSKSVYTPID